MQTLSRAVKGSRKAAHEFQQLKIPPMTKLTTDSLNNLAGSETAYDKVYLRFFD